ncbi:MAG: bile acid:sodium symporter family protein [Dokdonella sp.]
MLDLLRRLIDGYTLALIGTVVLASVLPASGDAARVLDVVSVLAIATLFFLHGARLSREAIIAGLVNWRLHGVVLLATFALFPLLGFLSQPLLAAWLTPQLVVGVLFLCALPSTVQSSIAFTSMARGNVPAAVCSASASNLIGVFATPLLVAMLLSAHGSASSPLHAIGTIVLEILLPFIAGHLLRPWLRSALDRRAALMAYTDRGTVLLIVYVAFSASVVEGLWRQLPMPALGATLVVVCLLLAVVLTITTWVSRRLGFAVEDEIVIVFCGSKKSLATGLPMAKILFAGNPALGMIVLPLLLFHQIQLMVCAVLAQRYARRSTDRAGKSALS